HTSAATKAMQASPTTGTEFMAETSLKPLMAILKTIREQADFALKQLQKSEEERSMRWKCKDCGYVKAFHPTCAARSGWATSQVQKRCVPNMLRLSNSRPSVP